MERSYSERGDKMVCRHDPDLKKRHHDFKVKLKLFIATLFIACDQSYQSIIITLH